MPRAGTPRKPGVKARYADVGLQTLDPLKGTKLTEQQRLFIEAYAKTSDKKNSAIAAGYSPASAPQRASECLQHPLAQQYLLSLQSESRAIAAYDVAKAMDEALDALNFAKKKGNANAYVKAVELRAKLSGLLIDRVEVFTADLKGALLEASKRVVQVSPGSYALEQLAQAAPQASEQATPEIGSSPENYGTD